MTIYKYICFGFVLAATALPSYAELYCNGKTKYQCVKLEECTWEKLRSNNSKKLLEHCTKNITEATIEDKRAKLKRLK